MEIKLRYINRSQSITPVDVVVFQQNMLVEQRTRVVAWRVIQHCQPGWDHPFIYSTELEMCLGDEFGNYSRCIKVVMGSMYVVTSMGFGRQLQYEARSACATRVQVRNAMERGAVNVNLCNAGKIIAVKTALVPGQMVDFEIAMPELWLATCSGLKEGQIVDSTLLEGAAVRFPLARIDAADLVLQGGASPQNAQPLRFAIENCRLF